MPTWEVAATIVLAAPHMIGGRLRFIAYGPRSRWLSFAGGVSVSYVFVQLLPTIARGQAVLAEEMSLAVFTDSGVWVAALFGVCLFYAVEIFTRRSRREVGPDHPAGAAQFWVSIVSYGMFNSIVGYLLHERAEAGSLHLAAFVIAMGLHFLVNDLAFREHHKQRYLSFGRWILVTAIAAGTFLGVVSEVSEVALVLTLSVLAGGVILNALKAELPAEAESRFGAFAVGVVAYTPLLLLAQ